MDEGDRKVMLFAQRHELLKVNFEAPAATDPFFNINTPEDFEQAEALLLARPS